MDLFSALQRRYEETDTADVLVPKSRRPPLTSACVEASGISTTTEKTSELCSTFSTVEALDISKNSLSSWNEALAPARILPRLSSLDISANVLLPRPVPSSIAPLPPSLTSLTVNSCSLDWSDAVSLARAAPGLRELSLCGNLISSISADFVCPSLLSLNLDGNRLSHWSDVVALSAFAPGLERLLLAANSVGSNSGDPFPVVPLFSGLRELSISNNSISTWEEVSAIPRWAPALRALRVTGNPVLKSMAPLAARTAVLANVTTLDSLNGSMVRPVEREEASRVRARQSQSSSATVAAAAAAGSAPPSGFSLVTLQCNAASAKRQETIQQRLPGSMTVGDLKVLCCRLFGAEPGTISLFFREREGGHDTVGAFPQPMEDDKHELRQYGSGGSVVIEEASQKKKK